MQMPVCTWTFLLKIGATNHPGKGLDPPPKRAMPKWTEIFLWWCFPKLMVQSMGPGTGHIDRTPGTPGSDKNWLLGPLSGAAKAECNWYSSLNNQKPTANPFSNSANICSSKFTQCTMRFRKKRAKNVQLWTLASSRIFNEKLWNFAQSCLNTSRIGGLFFFVEGGRH